MAFAKIKLLKDWKSHKAGEVVEANWDSANALVSGGAAEFVQKKSVGRPPKDKMVTGRKTRNK